MMKISKGILILCCLVGSICTGNAQIWRGVAKAPKAAGSAFKTTAAMRATQKAHLAKWSYHPLPEPDVQIGRSLLQEKLPEIGTTPSYVRRAKLAERWMPKLSPKLSEKLIARRVFESAFPGYMTDFMRDFRIFEEQSELSWTGELKKVLDSYGPQARFAGGFVSSFAEAVNFVSPYSRWSTNSQDALNAAWLDGAQQRSGFFVVAVESPLISGGKDVLLLDMKGKRFISLAQSNQAVQPKLAYEPKPVGNEEVGRALVSGLSTEPYATYTTDFGALFESTKEIFGVQEWIKVLNAYDPNAYYYAQFVPTLRDVVAYYPSLHYVSDYHGVGRHAAGGRDPFLDQHFYDVINQARQEEGGFFVVFKMRINERPSIVSRTEEDVLVLDLENKRFISLNESLQLAEHEQAAKLTSGATNQ